MKISLWGKYDGKWERGYFSRRRIHKIRYSDIITWKHQPEEGKGKGKRQHKLIIGEETLKLQWEINSDIKKGKYVRKKKKIQFTYILPFRWSSIRAPYTQHPKSKFPMPMLQWIPQTQYSILHTHHSQPKSHLWVLSSAFFATAACFLLYPVVFPWIQRPPALW